MKSFIKISKRGHITPLILTILIPKENLVKDIKEFRGKMESMNINKNVQKKILKSCLSKKYNLDINYIEQRLNLMDITGEWSFRC